MTQGKSHNETTHVVMAASCIPFVFDFIHNRVIAPTLPTSPHKKQEQPVVASLPTWKQQQEEKAKKEKEEKEKKEREMKGWIY